MFRLEDVSLRVKVAFWLGLLMVLLLAAAAVWWFVFREAWVGQPVMLRILEGTVETSTSQRGKFVEAANETWLAESNYIKTKKNSLVVLQYFEGSMVKIEGTAEVHLSRGRSLRRRPLDAGRSISLEVIRGKVTVRAVRQTAPGSLFEVVTLNSVGVVQGTIFEVEVDAVKGDVWEVGGGTVRVAAIVVGSDMMPMVALLPLDAGKAVAIPPLPEEWREDADALGTLVTLAKDIVRKSVEEGRADVSVKGASLLASNPETGTAVFKVEKAVKPALTAAAASAFSPIYKTIEDEILSRLVPGLIFTKSSVVKGMFIPSLSAPGAWAKPAPKIVRTSPPKYLFSIYNIAQPLGVAADPAGQRIAVTESGGQHVTRVFDDKGKEIMVLAPPDTVAAERDPSYVAIDGMGNVYVSDRWRHAIDMYDVNGAYLGVFAPRNNPGISWSPLGLASDASGNLYVTDVTSFKHRVMVFDSSGELKLEFGREGKEGGEFAFPNGITVDGNGRIYVADSNNFRLQAFDAQGQLLGVFSGVGFPRGMGVEGDYLYVVDTFEHMVRVYNTAQGMQSVFTFGGQGMGDGEFNFPNGLALDTMGRLYVTDRENNRVQVWGY